jgi:hypothetical protein
LPSSFFSRKPSVIPEPGQRVRLRAGRGRWRGNFRAISPPYSDEGLGVVIRIAEEKEYRKAVREGRRVFGIPWPAHQIEVVSSSKNAEQETQELPQSQRPRPEPRGFWFWRRLFGG